jgi:hypothetical protein
MSFRRSPTIGGISPERPLHFGRGDTYKGGARRVASALFILSCLLSIAGAQSSDKTVQAQAAPTSARAALEQMGPAERENARISVEFDSPDDATVALGRGVERLWNGGQYDEALAQLGDLEARVGCVAIGNSWRAPVPTLEASSWGSDVRIGNHDLLLGIALDVDPSSGNLFAALRHSGGGPHWSVCMSTDHGTTWDEIFTWVGSPSTWLDAKVLRHYAYVAYNSPGENPQQVRLRRFRCSDGLADTFNTGANWVAACTLSTGDTMREVSLANWLDGRLYLAALVSDGSVLLCRANANGVPWYTWATGITSGASSGLELASNEPAYETTSLFFSYRDTSDTLRVYRYGTFSGSYAQRFSVCSGHGTSTSISAFRDTVICAYEDEITSPHQVRYVTNYGEGDTWRVRTLSDSSIDAGAPAVLYCGGGFAAVYRQVAVAPELLFCQRTFSGISSNPVSIADDDPYNGRPEIVNLGSGVYGVAYLSDTSPVVRGAYFDKSGSPSGLAEQRRLNADLNVLNVTPSPLKGHGRLNYTLNRPADLRVEVYDRAGRLVRTLFDGHSPTGRQSLSLDASGMVPGVYFCRLTAGRASSDQAQAILKVVVIPG